MRICLSGSTALILERPSPPASCLAIQLQHILEQPCTGPRWLPRHRFRIPVWPQSWEGAVRQCSRHVTRFVHSMTTSHIPSASPLLYIAPSTRVLTLLTLAHMHPVFHLHTYIHITSYICYMQNFSLLKFCCNSQIHMSDREYSHSQKRSLREGCIWFWAFPMYTYLFFTEFL